VKFRQAFFKNKAAMNRKVTILGTAHRLHEQGKHSPDRRLVECVYSREIATELKAKLQAYGYPVLIDFEPLDLPQSMRSPNATIERQRELAMRVNYVNEVCRQQGPQNVLYVSIHVDASGKDGRWHDPHGWSVRVSPKASMQSRCLADCLYDAAKEHGLTIRQPKQQKKYWEQPIYVLKHTLCPAVLTENLFQDNEHDVDFLLSDEGRHAITRLHLEAILRYLSQQP